jgi:uncharacterized membrane protein YbhN (UPF0104 family)
VSPTPLASIVAGVMSVFDAAADRIAAVDPRLAAAALILQLSIFVFRAIAWRNALAAAYPEEHVSYLGVGAAYAVGVGLNGVVPARGGEVAKIALVRLQLPSSSVSAIAASGAVILMLDALIGGSLLATALATGGVESLPAPPGVHALGPLVEGQPVAAAAVVCACLVLLGLAVRRARDRITGFKTQFARGVAVLRTPRRYVRTVMAPQLAAWLCRIGVVLCLLAAFGLPATVPVALLVIVLGSVSTAVPAAPGGLGTQQLLLVYALREVASGATILTFSLGMQAGITAVNTVVGLTAAMLVFRTRRPLAALRTLRARD